MIIAVVKEGSLELMACDAQLLAQICCSHLFCLASLKFLTLTRASTLKETMNWFHESLEV